MTTDESLIVAEGACRLIYGFMGEYGGMIHGRDTLRFVYFLYFYHAVAVFRDCETGLYTENRLLQGLS